MTGAATSVGATTAVVEGKVDAGGEATSWYVEYGTSTSYGSRTSARSGGNRTSAVDVSEQLRESHDRRHLPLPSRRLERRRDEPRRRPDVLDARSADRRDEPRLVARADFGDGRRHGRPERPLDRRRGRVRHERELRVAHRHAVGRIRVERGERLRPADGPQGGGHVPRPARGLERPRHDPRSRPLVPHRPRANRLDGRGGRHRRLLGARRRIGQPPGSRQPRLVRVRDDVGARDEDGRPGRGLRDAGDAPLRAAHRPPAGHEGLLPDCRAERRRDDRRADAIFHDERRPTRGDRSRERLGCERRPDRFRRPRRPVDELVVGARADDVLRHDDGRQERGRGTRPDRGLRVRSLDTRRRLPRAARRTDLRGTTPAPT